MYQTSSGAKKVYYNQNFLFFKKLFCRWCSKFVIIIETVMPVFMLLGVFASISVAFVLIYVKNNI